MFVEKHIDWESYKCQSIKRLKQIENEIANFSSVLDVGAGDMTLKDMLKSHCTYQAINSYQSSNDTIVCDLNKKYPILHNVYDYAVCCGVCEYILDLNSFFKWVSNHCKNLIVSYSYYEKYGKIIERKLDNTRILNENDFLKVLDSNGFIITKKEFTILKQTIHFCINNNIKER